MRSSAYSNANARPTASVRPPNSAISRLLKIFGDTGPVGHFRVVDDADVTRDRISSETPVSCVRWSSASNIWRFAVASRCSTPYSMPARFRTCASRFCRVELGGERPLLGQRRLVFAAHRFGDLRDFRLDLRLGGLNGEADLHHLGMVRAELLRQLRALPLELRQLGLLLLDEYGLESTVGRLSTHAGILQRRSSPGCTPLPSGFSPCGSRERRVQVGEPLHDDVLPLLERHRAGALAVRLQRLLARFELRPLLAELLGEEVGGFLRRGRAQLDALPDVVVRPARSRSGPKGQDLATDTSRQRGGCIGLPTSVRLAQEPIDDARLRSRFGGIRRFGGPRRLEPLRDRVDRRHHQSADRHVEADG